MVWNYTWSFAPRLFQVAPWITEWIFALSYGCGIAAVLFNRPSGWLRGLFEWTPLRWMGLLSYSLYIWHEPLLLALQTNLGPTLTHLNHIVAIGLCGVLVLSISLFFCFFAYLLIEKPNMQLSERLRQQMVLQRLKGEEIPKTSPLLEPISIPASVNTPNAVKSGAPD
jgi:peptidoglycan/LPS O-acetylase OafA/YrhL